MPLHRLPDHESQNAVGDLSEFLKNTQSGDQIITVPLTNPAGAESPFASERLHTLTDKTFTAGAGVSASDATITFTKPSWATTGYVNVTASAGYTGTSGGFGTYTIYDGTTDYSTINLSLVTGLGLSATTGYAGEITATTTFTLRVAATTNNVTLQEQLIYGSVSWV